MKDAAVRALYLLWDRFTPASWFLLCIAAVLSAVFLLGRLTRTSLLGALGWRWAYSLGGRHWPLALRVLRSGARLGALVRWCRGRSYDAECAPVWPVLLCEAWLCDFEAAADADSTARRLHRTALYETLAAIYLPPPELLGRFLACAHGRDAADRGLWFAARAAAVTNELGPFDRLVRRLRPHRADESAADTWLGPAGCDAMRSVELLRGQAHTRAAAARHFADLLKTPGQKTTEWPDEVTRLRPWLEFLARCGDWHALIAAGSTLLQRRPSDAELGPVCTLLGRAYRKLAELTGASSQAARHYQSSADRYQNLARDLGSGALVSSHPRLLPTETRLAPRPLREPGYAAGRRSLRALPPWRSVGFCLAATALVLVTLAAVEAWLVVGTVKRARHAGSWEPAAPSTCPLGDGKLYAVGHGEAYWMFGQRALARYEPRIQLWSCFSYERPTSDAATAPTLSGLLDAGESIAKVRGAAEGPLLITTLGRVGLLSATLGTARLEWLSGSLLPPLEKPGVLHVAAAGSSGAALTDGEQIFQYDAGLHRFSASQRFALPQSARPTALAVTGEGPTFWLGSTSGLYFSEDASQTEANILLSDPIAELMVLDGKAARLLAFSRAKCDAGEAGVLTMIERKSGEKPEVRRLINGCESIGPPIREILDLLEGGEKIQVLTRRQLWSYLRSTQSWSAADFEATEAIQAGWLLGQGRLEATVVQIAEGLSADGEDGKHVWSWSGVITRGPFSSGSAISWQGRSDPSQPLSTFYATATRPPEAIAELFDGPPEALSTAGAAGHLCYSGRAEQPVRCLDPVRGRVRTVCDAQKDCTWGGTPPTLVQRGEAIEVVRTAAAGKPRELLSFSGPLAQAQLYTRVLIPADARPVDAQRLLKRLLLDGAGVLPEVLWQAFWLYAVESPAEPVARTTESAWSALLGRSLPPAQLVAMATSLHPVGADARGLIFETGSGQLLQHSGASYCGPRCMQTLSGKQELHQQERRISLRDGLSKSVELRCATVTTTPPKWQCQMQRGTSPLRPLDAPVLFPTDRIHEAWQDRRGIRASDEADFLFAISGDGTPAPVAAETPEPLTLERGGWTWSVSAPPDSAGAPLTSLLELSRGSLRDRLISVDVKRGGRLAFAHDVVLDAAVPPTAVCRRCLYALAQTAPTHGESSTQGAGVVPLLMRIGAGETADLLLPLPELPRGLSSDEEGILLAFDDRVIALEHDLGFRRAVYPMRWPAATAPRSVSISRVAGRDQLLVVPDARPRPAAQLLSPVRFTPSPRGDAQPEWSGPAGCTESRQLELPHGDRCPDDAAGTTALTLLRYIPDGRTWQGWRYRVRAADDRFCRVSALTCNAQPPSGAPLEFAVVVGDGDTAWFAAGAAVGEGRRLLVPGRKWAIEVLAQESEWREPIDPDSNRAVRGRTDPLLALHPVAQLWSTQRCGQAVAAAAAAAGALVRSSRGCGALGTLATMPRLRLRGTQRWDVGLARQLLRRTGDDLGLREELAADDLSPSDYGLVVREGTALRVMPSDAVLPP